MYMKSAKLGESRAQCNLGLMYDHGEGVEQDYGEAVRWYVAFVMTYPLFVFLFLVNS